MRKSDFILAFDIGSSKLRAIFAGRGVNDTLNIRGYKEINYDGFYEGNFLKQDKLSTIFEQVLQEFDIEPNKFIDKVYIGVPAEFSSVRTSEVSVNFGDRRKVSI